MRPKHAVRNRGQTTSEARRQRVGTGHALVGMLHAQVELHEGAADCVNPVAGSSDTQLERARHTGASQTTRCLPPAGLKARAFHSRARRRPAGATIGDARAAREMVALHATAQQLLSGAEAR